VRRHHVTLPYPDETEPTVGTCACGWTVVYGWGEHSEALDEAGTHVEAETRTEPIELEQMSGKRFVIPGRSL
jgi:hypothetical protein